MAGQTLSVIKETPHATHEVDRGNRGDGGLGSRCGRERRCNRSEMSNRESRRVHETAAMMRGVPISQICSSVKRSHLTPKPRWYTGILCNFLYRITMELIKARDLLLS